MKYLYKIFFYINVIGTINRILLDKVAKSLFYECYHQTKLLKQDQSSKAKYIYTYIFIYLSWKRKR